MASGIIIRDETVLTSGERYLDVTAADGTKVAAGAQLAIAVSSEEGLERANRIHELEREISRISAALREMRSADDLTTREASLTGAARDLAAAVARHDADTLDGAALNLETLLMGVDGDTVTAQNLSALERELQSLQSSAGSGAATLTAETPGVFSTVVDGYEHLGFEDLRDLTPAALRKMIDEGGTPESGAYGKLIGDHRWYFAAVMDAVDAAHLTVGRTATLNFGRWYNADIFGKLVSISNADDGETAVVFLCDAALADTLAVRNVSATVVFDSYSGIRIPAQAVRTDDETQSTYVWAVTAMQLERKDIEIIYAAEDFVIVRRGSDPGSLREGNTVVVSGKDLYEGKIIE